MQKRILLALFIILITVGCTSEKDIQRARDDGYQSGYSVGVEEGREQGYQQGYDKGYETGSDEGRDSGLQLGREEGLEEGYNNGFQEGIKQGYQEGYETGFTEGERAANSAFASNSFIRFTLPAIILGFIIVIIISLIAIILTRFGWEKAERILRKIISEIGRIFLDIADLIFSARLSESIESNHDDQRPTNVLCVEDHENSPLQVFCSTCQRLLIPMRDSTILFLVIVWWSATIITGLIMGIRHTSIPAYVYTALSVCLLIYVKLRFFPKAQAKFIVLTIPITLSIFVFAFASSIAEGVLFRSLAVVALFVIFFDLLRRSYQQYRSDHFTSDVLLVLVGLIINSLLSLFLLLITYLNLNATFVGNSTEEYRQILNFIERSWLILFGTIVVFILLKALFAVYKNPIKVPTSLDILPIKKIDREAIRFRNTQAFFLFRIFVSILNLIAQPVAIGYNALVVLANSIAAIIITITRFLFRYSKEILVLLIIYFSEILRAIYYFLRNVLYPTFLILALFISTLQIANFSETYAFNPEIQKLRYIGYYLVAIGVVIALLTANFTKKTVKETVTSSFIDTSFSTLYFFLMLGISSITLLVLKTVYFHSLPYELNFVSITGLWIAIIVIMMLVAIVKNQFVSGEQAESTED